MKYIKELFVLSVPIIIGQLSWTLIGLGDVYVAGLYSTEVLAAIGIANALLVPVLYFMQGLCGSIIPLVIAKNKIKDSIGINLIIYSGLLFLIGSFFLLIVIWSLSLWNYSENITNMVKDYLFIIFPSLIGHSLFIVFKEYLQSQESVIIPNLIMFFGAFINVGMNIILVFGLWGFPVFGFYGLAYASLIIRLLTGVSLLTLVKSKIHWNLNYSYDFLIELLKKGFPVGLMVLTEVGGFAASTLIVAKMGVLPAAAHNIVLNILTVLYMVPYSISSALSVKVALSITNTNILKKWVKTSLTLVIFYMVMCSFLFFYCPHFLLEFFTHDKELIRLGASFFLVAGCFQLVDGIQVIFAGALRGMGKTEISFLANFVGYWIVGLPLGAFLTFKTNLGPTGIWWGLFTALFCVAFSLAFYFRKETLRNSLSIT